MVVRIHIKAPTWVNIAMAPAAPPPSARFPALFKISPHVCCCPGGWKKVQKSLENQSRQRNEWAIDFNKGNQDKHTLASTNIKQTHHWKIITTTSIFLLSTFHSCQGKTLTCSGAGVSTWCCSPSSCSWWSKLRLSEGWRPEACCRNTLCTCLKSSWLLSFGADMSTNAK